MIDDDSKSDAPVLNLFCCPEHGAWRVYVRPTWLPRYLQHCFDEHGEAYPVYLDLEDLDHYMSQHGAAYEKAMAKHGGAELTARGDAANTLALWLSRMFASTVRPRDSVSAESEESSEGKTAG